MTQTLIEKFQALIKQKIDLYDSQMEGADYDDFIRNEWAAGAMRQLQKDLRAIIAEQEKSKISEGLKNSQAEQSEPAAYRVIGPYEDSPFRDKSSAEAFCRGLNKGFGEGSYLIEPLYTAPQPTPQDLKSCEYGNEPSMCHNDPMNCQCLLDATLEGE